MWLVTKYERVRTYETRREARIKNQEAKIRDVNYE